MELCIYGNIVGPSSPTLDLKRLKSLKTSQGVDLPRGHLLTSIGLDIQG